MLSSNYGESMKKSKVLIIVPVYNESENIEFIINDLKSVEYDVVFINDASTDDSLQKLKQNSANVVALPINLGIGGCMQTGYLYAKENSYDIAIQYDGDGQHVAEHTRELVSKIEAGYDYAIGSRYVSNEDNFKSSTMRRIGIKMLSTLIRFLTGKRILDVTSGFRACNKELIEYFTKYYPTDYPEPEVAGALAKQGYDICETPVQMRKRQGGESSIKPLKSVYYMAKVSISILTLSNSYKKAA